MTQDKIRDAYMTYFLENGKDPETVFVFCKKLKISESEFYDLYTSFIQIQADIWKHIFIEARQATEKEDVYANYSVREKVLAFYFTLIEVFKRHRSYILKIYPTFEQPILVKKQAHLIEMRHFFYDFINDLLLEGQQTKEIEKRPIGPLMQKYPDLFWAKTLLILDFWVKDESKAFEKTDTFIEKTVNTAFDFLGRTPFDSLLDLGKFMFQNRH